ERRLAKLDAELGDLTAGLGPEGRAVYELIANRYPDRVAELIARLPDAIRRELRALDLKSRDLSAIAGPVLLIHGEDDAIIPPGEVCPASPRAARPASALRRRSQCWSREARFRPICRD